MFTRGDILCEMRFYVPNIEDKILEEHEKKLEEKERIKQKKKDEEKALKMKNKQDADADGDA